MVPYLCDECLGKRPAYLYKIVTPKVQNRKVYSLHTIMLASYQCDELTLPLPHLHLSKIDIGVSAFTKWESNPHQYDIETRYSCKLILISASWIIDNTGRYEGNGDSGNM